MKPTTTPASGTRRYGKLRVRKAWIGQNDIAYPAEKFLYGDGSREPCHIIEGSTGTAARLKRLAEIAAMDDLPKHLARKLWETSSLRHGLFLPNRFQAICEDVIAEALGLSPKNSKKAWRKLK